VGKIRSFRECCEFSITVFATLSSVIFMSSRTNFCADTLCESDQAAAYGDRSRPHSLSLFYLVVGYPVFLKMT